MNGTKLSIYRKNLELADSPLEIKLIDPSGRMTSTFSYEDCIDQLNVPLDTKQMLHKAIKVNDLISSAARASDASNDSLHSSFVNAV